MAGDRTMSVHTLDRPEDLKALLKEDRGDDCLPCKLVGSAAFIGLGAYTYFSGNSQLEQQKARILASKSRFGMRSRRMGIASISLGLAAMGFWRLAG
ncbi:putative exosome complex exonuclease [Podospora aff. communis PSN243]|uniref:Exosome complex exonuclease n=1 Tax=Podospora aff. communis PSN243 TaxID=3040156 RepID=A0AAV9GHW4_9PEZI|nr:putative exosome complex exonuclease [Podospora aff. communis PSN243]